VFRGGSFWRPTEHAALKDVSFAVERGKMLAIVGESGSGKSTIARLILRLMAPTEGEVWLGGENVLAKEPNRPSVDYRRRVQMIFQDPFGSLNPARTVAHHLERPLRIHGLAADATEARAKAKELLHTVGLEPAEDFLERFPHELSGGQRQRVAIARALAPEPEVIVADEPTSMLDVSLRMGILNLLDRLKTQRKIAFLFITHDVASARYLADDMLVMYAGQAVEHGPAESVVGHARHPYTRLLLASVPDPARRFLRDGGTDGGPVSLPMVPNAVAGADREGGGGCPFLARCAHRTAPCASALPERRLVSSDHWVRCHHRETLEFRSNFEPETRA
jgi:peptide/nickel transport system ATP-binding protein